MDRVQNQNNVNGPGLLAPNPNNNNRQDQQVFAHARNYQRTIPAELIQIGRMRQDETPLMVSVAGFSAFLTPGAKKFLLASCEWRQMQNHAIHSVSQVVYIPADNWAAFRFGDGLYGLDTEEFQERYGDSFRNFIAQYNPGKLGLIGHDLLDYLGQYLPTDDINNLSQANRQAFNAPLARRRQGIDNAILLARGEVSRQADGNFALLPYAVTGPVHFNTAFEHIKTMPPPHQKEPLQALIRTAQSQEQFEAVFDHLENEGKLPEIQRPRNFERLSPEGQRAVEIFSWRLTGHTEGDPPVPSTQEQRDRLLNAYADLLESVNGRALPLRQIRLSWDDNVEALLDAFDAPENLDLRNGRQWIRNASQEGNLQLTTQIFLRLPQGIQYVIQNSIPTNSFSTRASFNHASGYWSLYPKI